MIMYDTLIQSDDIASDEEIMTIAVSQYKLHKQKPN